MELLVVNMSVAECTLVNIRTKVKMYGWGLFSSIPNDIGTSETVELDQYFCSYSLTLDIIILRQTFVSSYL